MNVQLYLGDCLEIMQTLEDGSVDAIITEIPYGTTACSWDEIISFDKMWEQVKRITSVFITTSSQPFTSKLVMSNLEWFKYEWVWNKVVKRGHLVSKIRPLQQTESILVFGRNKIKYIPQETQRDKPIKMKEGSKTEIMGKKAKSNYRTTRTTFCPSNLITFSNGGDKNKVHPTQKPIPLYEYLIHTYTNEDDTVLDIAMGSGTTGVACVQTGRNFIGIEIEPKYFEIAEARIAEAQLQIRMEI